MSEPSNSRSNHPYNNNRPPLPTKKPRRKLTKAASAISLRTRNTSASASTSTITPAHYPHLTRHASTSSLCTVIPYRPDPNPNPNPPTTTNPPTNTNPSPPSSISPPAPRRHITRYSEILDPADFSVVQSPSGVTLDREAFLNRPDRPLTVRERQAKIREETRRQNDAARREVVRRAMEMEEEGERRGGKVGGCCCVM